MIHGQGDPRTPRERRHDETLARILDAAMELVVTEGTAALSIQKLAARVDYTPGALYRYFDSKDAILARLVERTLGEVSAHLARAEAALPGRASPLARVFALAIAYRDFARTSPHRFGLLAMTLAEPRVVLERPEDAEPVARVMIGALGPLAAALGDAAEAGLLAPGDAAERTVCLFALLQGVLQMSKQARVAPALLDVDRLVAQGARSLLVGWGGEPKKVDTAARAARSASTEGDER